MLKLIDKDLEACSGGSKSVSEYESGSVPHFVQNLVGNPETDIYDDEGIAHGARQFIYNHARGVAITAEALVLALGVAGVYYGAKKMNKYLKERKIEKEKNKPLLWRLVHKIV